MNAAMSWCAPRPDAPGLRAPDVPDRRAAVQASCRVVDDAAAVRVLAELAVDRGEPLTRVLAGTGLQPQDLRHPGLLVLPEQERQMIANLIEHCGDRPGLGFAAGRRRRLVSMPGAAKLMACATLAEAFALLAPGACASSAGRDSAGHLRLVFGDAGLPAALRRFLVERDIGTCLSLGSDLLGRALAPRAATLAFAQPGDIELYEQLLYTRPTRDATTMLLIDRADADEALRRSAHWLALQPGWREGSSLAQHLAGLLARQPERMSDMRSVAAALCMSERTLRRRLKQEGTSYLSICHQVREALAERLLAQPGLQIGQVAERLGYSETAGFIHAFKRWKGCTPTGFRSTAVADRSARWPPWPS